MPSRTSHVWLSPTLCGCVLEKHHDFRISQAVKNRIAESQRDPQMIDLMLRYLESQGQYDEVETSHVVLRRCESHRHLSDSELVSELYNYGQNVWKPDTCGCALVYHFDKRLSAEDRIHVPLEHPVHTKRCEEHAHHRTAKAHHAAVIEHHARTKER